MLLFFLIFFPIVIAAKWDIVTSVSPTLEAINDSHVYVDYSKAFTVNFDEIEKAEVKGFQQQKSKAGREIRKIEVVGNTIFQPLDKNRKILAKLNICGTCILIVATEVPSSSFIGETGQYFEVTRRIQQRLKVLLIILQTRWLSLPQRLIFLIIH